MKYYGTKDGINYGFHLQQFDGAKEISDDEWKRLLNEQANGKKICLGDDGNVIAVEEVITCDELASDIRRKRDDLLRDTDWTQLLDCKLGNDKIMSYAEYRQLLRDIPQQKGFPDDVEWPVKP